MSIIARDLNDEVALSELLSLLVENDSILIELLGLADDGHSLTRHGSVGFLSLVPIVTKVLTTHALGGTDSWQIHSLVLGTIHSASAATGSHETASRETIAELIRILANLFSVFALFGKVVLPSFHAVG